MVICKYPFDANILILFCVPFSVLLRCRCDGPCMRSFHAKIQTGEDSYCKTLGFTEAEVEVAFEILSDKDSMKFRHASVFFIEFSLLMCCRQ